MSCCVFCSVCCWGICDCVKYTQIAWASPDTHRHCCVVVVGPEIGSPHEGFVPWSSPRGASLSCTQICALYLGMKATAPAFLKQSCVPSVLGLYFSCVSLSHLLLCHSLPFAIPLRPSLPPEAGLLLLLTQWPSLPGSQHRSALTKRCQPFQSEG